MYESKEKSIDAYGEQMENKTRLIKTGIDYSKTEVMNRDGA